MRIVLIDSDSQFASMLTQKWKGMDVFIQSYPLSTAAFTEIKKNPDAVDIILVAKEQSGGQDLGLSIAENLRKDPKLAEVPYILLSSVWGKAEFAKHQKTPNGANAYFSKKNPLTELEATIQAVTGFKFSPAAKGAKTNATSMTATGTVSGINVQLQVANDVVNISEEVPEGIALAAPISLFGEGEEPATPAPVAAPTAVKVAEVSVPTPAPTLTTEPTPTNSSVTMPTVTTADPAAANGIMISVGDSLKATAPPQTAGEIEIKLGSENLEIETTGKKGKQAAAPEAPKVETPKIEIPISTEASSSNEPPVTVNLTQEIPQSVPLEQLAVANSAVTNEASLSISQLKIETPEPKAMGEAVAPPVSEEEAAKELPYLFTGAATGTKSLLSPGQSSSVSSHVEINTGGPLSNDVETLKKYLTMREQDVSVLSAQLTYAKEEISKSEETIKRLALTNEDLGIQVTDLKKRIEAQEQELAHAGKSLEGEVEQLRFEVKSKIDRIKFLDDRLKDSAEQYEKLKERVRLDIRKIRVREKELESKLEILKKDSETLIAARENKILELKRKIDMLEFNYDTLQDKNESEKENVKRANEKLERVLKVMKLATGIIEAANEEGATEAPQDRTDSAIKIVA